MRNFVLFAWRAYSCWVVPGVCPSLVFMATLFAVVFLPNVCRAMFACSHSLYLHQGQELFEERAASEVTIPMHA